MIYVVGGGSIASGKVSSRINLTNAFSDSCAVYYALTMRLGVGRESQPDLLPFACQRTYHTGAVHSRGRDAADGWDPSTSPVLGVYDGFCKGTTGVCSAFMGGYRG